MGLAGVRVAFMMSQEKEAVSGLFFFFSVCEKSQG